MTVLKKLADFAVEAATEIAGLFKMLDLIKVQALNYYLQGVQKVRQFCLFLVLVFAALLLFACGFILMHVAFLMYAPLEPLVKFALLLGLGGIYCLFAALFLGRVFSEKKWIEFSKANRWMEEVGDKK